MIQLDIKVSSGTFELDKKHLRAVFRAAGAEVAAAARQLIRRAAGGGKKHGRHRASAPGQPPASESGALARSIRSKVYKSGLGVAVRAFGGGKGWYAAPLEVGARHYSPGSKRRHRAAGAASGVGTGTRMAARPFMSVALARKAPSIGPRIEDALVRGIAFKKQAR